MAPEARREARARVVDFMMIVRLDICEYNMGIVNFLWKGLQIELVNGKSDRQLAICWL